MKRQISFGQALATVVGSVIGAGVFFKIGTITAQTGSTSMTLFVWILAGIISIASGLTISEIAASLKINGAIKYLDYTYSSFCGAFHDKFVQYQRNSAHTINSCCLFAGRFRV